MDEHHSRTGTRGISARDRRYAIRFPLAADATVIDLETGNTATGVTSDVSYGGCFVCTNKPLPVKARVRITLQRKDTKMEALAVVRAVKPRVGMGVEFLDMDQQSFQILERWMGHIKRVR